MVIWEILGAFWELIEMYIFKSDVLITDVLPRRHDDRVKQLFYHDVGEISDLSQSEAPNLVM